MWVGFDCGEDNDGPVHVARNSSPQADGVLLADDRTHYTSWLEHHATEDIREDWRQDLLPCCLCYSSFASLITATAVH